MTIKTCGTCVHYHYDGVYRCRREGDVQFITDIVSGDRTIDLSRLHLCEKERKPGLIYVVLKKMGIPLRERCGEDGKFWGKRFV